MSSFSTWGKRGPGGNLCAPSPKSIWRRSDFGSDFLVHCSLYSAAKPLLKTNPSEYHSGVWSPIVFSSFASHLLRGVVQFLNPLISLSGGSSKSKDVILLCVPQPSSLGSGTILLWFLSLWQFLAQIWLIIWSWFLVQWNLFLPSSS